MVEVSQSANRQMRYMKLVFACCAITCVALQAQTQTNKTLSLSLQQVVEMAVEHNLDVQISRYQPLTDEFLLSEAYAVYEPAFNSSVQRAWQTSPGSVSSAGVVNFANRSDDSTAQASIGSPNGGM